MEHPRITVDVAVMVGKPVIRGTRIPVEQVLRELAGGMSHADILDAHPRLTADDIRAVLEYAAAVIASEDITLSTPDHAALG